MAICYTRRLAEAASVRSSSDPYDNAMAGAFSSLFKVELVRNAGPCKIIDNLETAVAEYDWLNHRRLHGEIGLVPPVEFEDQHCAQHIGTADAEPAVVDTGIRDHQLTRGDDTAGNARALLAWSPHRRDRR